MTALGWVGVAGACAVSALPSPAVTRAGALAGAGRLLSPRDRRSPVTWSTGRWVSWTSGIGVVGMLAIVTRQAGPAVALGVAALAAVAATLLRDTVTDRRDTRRRRALLTALRVLAGELAAGAMPGDALRAAAATEAAAAEQFAPLLEGDALASDAPVRDEPTVRALTVAWSLAASGGAALAEVVDRVAADLADDDARRRAVAVALAGPRASAVMLSALPAVGLALGAAIGARPLDFLLADPIGHVVCCGGMLLDAAGVLWVRRIVRRAQR